MKKIIPFKKEIIFKNNISEITSISLEHHLTIDNLEIKGEFIVSGDYKITDNSESTENFNINIPFEIILDEKYDTSKSNVDIDDFYYEIIDEKILSVSIDVLVDKLSEILIQEEIPVIEEKKDIIEELYEEQNRLDIEKEEIKKEVPVIKEETEEKNVNRCIEEDDILPGEEESIKMDEKQVINEKQIDKEEKNNDKKEIEKEEINDKINSLFSNTGEGNIYVSYNVYIIREGDTIETILNKYNITEEELKKYNDLSNLKLGDKIIIPS